MPSNPFSFLSLPLARQCAAILKEYLRNEELIREMGVEQGAEKQ